MPVIDEDKEERERMDKKKSSSTSAGAGAAAAGAGAGGKTKDLSHVPCKFYKVGSCTAGSSCPFSHSGVSGPGAQKDVCAWFVKGNNCKFGHKCALAHVLPGQSMSMDRKNKKLAQQQAQAGKEGKESREGREGKGRRRDAPQARPPTTLSLKSLKASISPSAPAPALNDTDFTSFSALEPDKLPTAPAVNGKQPKSDPVDTSPSSPPKRDFGPIGSPPKQPVAMSTSPGTPTNNLLSSSPYRQSVLRSPSGSGGASGTAGTASSLGRMGLSMNRSTSSGNSGGLTLGAGVPGGKNPSWGSMGNGSDIGSLPSLPSALLRPLNGIQPHTPITPTSARQGVKDFDLTFEYDDYLGNGPGRGGSSAIVIEENVEGDLDDLDDFLPSSLTELLTPEERKRRMSRSNSSSQPQQDTHNGLPSPQSYNTRRALGVPLASRVEGNSTPGGTPGHRYSRSVPMGDLGNLSSIWANQDQNPIPSPNANANAVSSSFTGPSSLSGVGLGGGLPSSPPRRIGNGTPGSFTSASGRLAADDYYPYTGGSPGGMSGVNPSNASAAFLPGYGFGTAYIKAKRDREAAAAAANANIVGAAQRSVSGGILTNSRMGAGAAMPGTPPSGATMAYGTPTKEPSGIASAAPYVLGGIAASRDMGGMERSMGLGGVGLGGGMETAVSPSTRAALQSHAPGQSLPQGLAAGLSRMHAKTSMQVGSLSSVGSPPTGGLSPGLGGLGFYSGPYGTNRMQQQSQPQLPPGLGLSGSGSSSGYYGQQQQQQFNNYQQQQQMSGQQPQQSHSQLQSQPQPRYNPLNPTFNSSSQSSGPAPGAASGSSELDAMFNKLAFNPQAPSAHAQPEAPTPMSYAGAAATRSASGLQKTAATAAARSTNGGGPDDDLFDMDEA